LTSFVVTIAVGGCGGTAATAAAIGERRPRCQDCVNVDAVGLDRAFTIEQIIRLLEFQDVTMSRSDVV
jgi:hypothetical protein